MKCLECWAYMPVKKKPRIGRPPRYCSRPCKIKARDRRYLKRKARLGACVICGRPAFPYMRCWACRADHRKAKTGNRPNLATDRRMLPKIDGRALSHRVLDACARFASITETVWKADPASCHTNEHGKGTAGLRASPSKGTQDRRPPR